MAPTSGELTSTFELMASFNNHVKAPSATKLVLPITGGLSLEPANKKQKKEAQRSVQHVGVQGPFIKSKWSLLGVCFVAEGPIRRNTFERSTQKQSRSYQSESFVAYFQMHRLKDEMTNRPMITCIMIVIFCKGHECNFSQAASCAYK